MAASAGVCQPLRTPQKKKHERYQRDAQLIPAVADVAVPFEFLAAGPGERDDGGEIADHPPRTAQMPAEVAPAALRLDNRGRPASAESTAA